jgi:hypothetical protein
MDVRLIHVDPSEAGHRFTGSLGAFPVQEEAEAALKLDVFLERDLGAGEKAHGDVRLANISKTARN